MAPEAADWSTLLTKYADPFAQAEEFSDWMPPLGHYTASVESVRTGVTKDGVPYWSVKALLHDGVDEAGNSLVGRTFSLQFLSLKPGREGMMKSFVSSVTGQKTNDITEADALLRGSVGTVLRVEIVASKDGQYKNARIRDIASPASQTAAPAAADDDDDDDDDE